MRLKRRGFSMIFHERGKYAETSKGLEIDGA
jgi:hypothetical protein